MGNSQSNNTVNDNIDCIICWEKIEKIDIVQCTRCNINLHAYCEQTYRGGKGYCKCPHCQRIGTLGMGHWA